MSNVSVTIAGLGSGRIVFIGGTYRTGENNGIFTHRFSAHQLTIRDGQEICKVLGIPGEGRQSSADA